MSKIGTFNKAAVGSLNGTLHTIGVTRDIEFQRIEKASQNAPSFRAVLPGTEIIIGAGWLKTAKESGNGYVSVMMDDPTLPAPLYARLVKDKDSEAYSLYWERSSDNNAPTHSNAEATPEI